VVSTLDAPAVARVLAELRAYAAVEDAAAKDRVRERADELGRRITTAEKYAVYGEAPPLAVSVEVGELLYALTLARRPEQVVEFGASHGISTIHLAAALRDAGRGTLVTTEILPGKAAATARNLVAAGLGNLVDVRLGDARATLQGVEGPVGLVFLDGRNDLYLPVLELLEPILDEHAIVIADLSLDDPDLLSYLEHVRRFGAGYVSRQIPLGAGVELSVRSGANGFHA
jgi:predicted O-methyltransferase YrrM